MCMSEESNKKMNTLIAISSVMGLMLAGAETPEPKPYGPLPSKAQLAWHEIETYSLPCFSMPTFKNVEWAYGDDPASTFDPTDFNAEQIVQSAKDGGLKGFILVAKHHDGFCLWPTKTTEYSIKNSPWKDGKGDMVKEFADACRKHGLVFGLYCSPWDRNHPEYGRPGYVKVYHEQLRELWTNYGELFEVWFDGAAGGTGYYGGAREDRAIDRKSYYDYPTIFNMLDKLQPNAVMFSELGPDVRWCGNESGSLGDPCWATYTPKYRGTQDPVKFDPKTGQFVDFPNGATSYEQAVNGHRDGNFWMPSESDFPLRPGWFYHKSEDSQVRDPWNLIHTYFVTVGRGGSFNIGLAPDRRGQMHDNDVASLKKFGDWMKDTFSNDLAAGATVLASNTRGNSPKFAGKNLLDGLKDTYWSTDDQELTPELILDLGNEVEFNVVSLREYLPLGQRVDDWALEAWQGGKWVEFAQGTALGSRRLVRTEYMTASKVRLRITKAAACPAIRQFALYREPDWARQGPVSKHNPEFGISREGWKIHDLSYEAPNGGETVRAIDGNLASLWHTHGADGGRGAPQYLAIDMGKEVLIDAFLCMPRSDGTTRAIVDQYEYHVSTDGKNWKKVAEGEFGNIVNMPVLQTVKLKNPVTARYFKFTATHSADGIPVSVSELGVQENVQEKK